MGILDRFRLDGRVALVTGGAGPLFGSSVSCALAEAGGTVVTASRSLARNEKFASDLCERGWQAFGMEVDITNQESIDRLHGEMLSRFGRIDVLVNCAVTRSGHNSQFGEEKEEELAAVAAGDFLGLFTMCKHVVGTMVRQGKGSIINISSIYGVVANDPTMYTGTSMVQPPSYNFVKAGMVNFTRYLAAYYSRCGVRANCISPGGYFNNQPKAFVDEYVRRAPIGRMMDHTDIQGAVVFLASDASEYVTGENLMVDGGWTCV